MRDLVKLILSVQNLILDESPQFAILPRHDPDNPEIVPEEQSVPDRG